MLRTAPSMRWSVADALLASRMRGAIAFAAVGAGAVVGAVANATLGANVAIALLALPLALPVAIAKSATACGMNALATFSQYDQPTSSRLSAAGVFAATACLTATGLGILIASIGDLLGASRLMPVAALVSLYLGLREIGLLGHRPVLSSAWQVPSWWVRGRRSAPVVWGVFLGSGLATQMPYPSFYALLFVIAVLGWPLGVVVMALYGFARALPAVAAAITGRCAGTADLAVLLRFRLLGHATSGLGCLALSGGLAASIW